jgi:hypothetical protein
MKLLIMQFSPLPHLRLGLVNGLFLSGVPTEMLYATGIRHNLLTLFSLRNNYYGVLKSKTKLSLCLTN